MSNPVSFDPLRPLGPAQPPRKAPEKASSFGDDFASAFRDQLARVSRMQNEADEQVQALLTGQSSNVTDVFTAARKAEVAFSMLMEIRNKLVDAYQELQNLRI
ncbi:MAG: flagellar hook-basal body complex protein FliE [Planctomycetes bacterium]|nr:flagellar hook-basal body complex protein FliE [Planctomycetota bacterium]